MRFGRKRSSGDDPLSNALGSEEPEEKGHIRVETSGTLIQGEYVCTLSRLLWTQQRRGQADPARKAVEWSPHPVRGLDSFAFAEVSAYRVKTNAAGVAGEIEVELPDRTLGLFMVPEGADPSQMDAELVATVQRLAGRLKPFGASAE